MQQSSIYSRRSFVGSACGTIRVYIFSTLGTPQTLVSLSLNGIADFFDGAGLAIIPTIISSGPSSVQMCLQCCLWSRPENDQPDQRWLSQAQF
jgi:hypothetical protein